MVTKRIIPCLDVRDGRVVDVYKRQELEQKLMEAIVAVEQPPALACAAPVGSAELPMAVKNLYYSILSDHPEYKYAYDLTSEVGEDGLLRCKVSYMPYLSLIHI